jgi:hypothetical protein
MLRILGSARRLCDGPTRRDTLQIGAATLLGLALPDLLRAESAPSPTPEAKKRDRHFGKAKSCILLYLYGSPSQLETFDTKPDAPVGIRGELGAIRSNVPGTLVGELLPHTAKVMDKMTVVRSVNHPYPIHGAAYALTGVPTIDAPMELNPRDSRHWPFIGSVVEYLAQTQGKKRKLPSNIALPFPFSSQRTGEVQRAGPYAAFLGSAYNPIWTRFEGKATAKWTKTLGAETKELLEPYMGISPESHFAISAGEADGASVVNLDRLDSRRGLLEQFDRATKVLHQNEAVKSFDRQRARAVDLLTSTAMRTALDVRREAPKTRESFGHTLFGQSCLAARRLIEAGSRFVSVFWDEFGLAGSGWDTHWEHYPRMKQELCPGFDRAFSGLLHDLDTRGLLEETLVVCLSEHGRTPTINSAKGGGRDHWSRAYSVQLAGAGVARGKIVGKTDRIAGDVVEHPVSPKDILATVYHLLGIDTETILEDRLGRPMAVMPGGTPIAGVLA